MMRLVELNMKVVCARKWVEDEELGNGWGAPIACDYVSHKGFTDESKQMGELPHNMGAFSIDTDEEQKLVDAPDVWVLGQGTPEEFITWLNGFGMDKQSIAANAPLYNLKDPELISLMQDLLS